MVKELWSQIKTCFVGLVLKLQGVLEVWGLRFLKVSQFGRLRDLGFKVFLEVKGSWTFRCSVFKVFEVFGVKGCCSIPTLCFKFIHGPRIQGSRIKSNMSKS